MKKILMIVAIGLISSPMIAQVNDDDQIYRRADKMPVYQQCEDPAFVDHPYRCTIKQLMDFFNNSIEVENPLGMQTKGLLTFVVEADGSVSGVELQRPTIVNTGDESQDAAIEEFLNASIIEKAGELSFSEAGEHEGEVVRVSLQFSVPVNY